MNSVTTQIPNVFLSSDFPDRDKIVMLSEWEPEQVHEDLEVYEVRERRLITVNLPTDLFNYDEKTRTL